jgi:hypothetical protein
MSDLKAPTYKSRFPRRSGLYGPTCHLFAQRHFQKAVAHHRYVGPEGTDLQIPISPVGRAFMVRRAIFSHSDIFKRAVAQPRYVGPEGTDLQIPISP